MVRVEFPEEQIEEEESEYEEMPEGLAGFLLKKGIAKNRKQANQIIFVAALVFFVLAAIFYFF